MWLLNTETLKLQDFFGDLPPYAILSHTWADGEVSFQVIGNDVARDMPGYEKIRRSCAFARFQGYEYIWIDTCCIDKKSSAELSEAINSMYTWYSRAAVCYAFMSDVTRGSHDPAFQQFFQNSRWFSRGWTLQELLAPKHFQFYNHEWQYIGNKSSLLSLISGATGIDEMYINDPKSIYNASIGARMSWASTRRTTRTEDEAYCLLGIFDINMPLLYGEGHKAFIRLQHEIAKVSDDESLFAWHTKAMVAGPFAPDALAFRHCGDILTLSTPSTARESVREASMITNRGLRLEVRCRKLPFTSLHGHSTIDRLYSDLESSAKTYILLVLNCAHRGREDRPITIILMQKSQNQYIRFLPAEIMVFERYLMDSTDNDVEGLPQRIYIQEMEYRGGLVRPPRINLACSHTSAAGYNLKEWVISPLGSINFRNDVGRSFFILFQGWSGFTILKFEHIGGNTIIAIVKAIQQEAARSMTLYPLPPDIDNLAEAKKFCYAQRGFFRPVFDPTTSILYRDQTGIFLERSNTQNLRKNYNFILRIVQMPKKNSASSSSTPATDIQS
ncbi:MAG: hypothetical protein Q9172_001913 [Xanthocarpia lactea]